MTMTDGDSSYNDFSQWVRGLRSADIISEGDTTSYAHDASHENRRPRNDGVAWDDKGGLHYTGDCITTESMCERTTCSSSLTGGFTTITNILDGSPDAVVDQRCSPSRSIFQVVDVMDTPLSNAGEDDSNYDHDSHFGTFASYYNMQRNGPQSPDAPVGCEPRILKQYEIDGDDADQSVDTEEGGRGFCEQRHAVDYSRVLEDDHNSNGGRSSLSSITNEFFYPKFNGRGRFINYSFTKKNVKAKKTNNSSNSPPFNKRKSPSSNTMNTSTMHATIGRDGLVDKVAAPLYSISTIQLQPHFHLEEYSEQREQYLQEQGTHTVLNDAHPLGLQTVVVSRPPSEVHISPLGHVNSLVKVPHSSSQTPSVISSSDLSQYFTNDLRERYKLIIHRSYRTNYHQFINSSCAKKSIVALVSISLIVAMITTTTIVLGRHVPRAWTPGANITLVIPGRDGIPYACCVDGNTGLFVPQDESNLHLQDEQEINTSEEPASSSSNTESSTSGTGPILEESGLISFSSSKGDVKPTNDPAPTLNNLAPSPNKQATHSSPTGLPTKASKLFASQGGEPTTAAFASLSSPSSHPVLVNPSIVRIKSVDTTIDEQSPDVNYGDKQYLSIKGSNKVALVKFDLSVLNGHSFHKASLVLHSLLNEQGDESVVQVSVGVLPQAGDWDEESLTWRDVRSSRAGSFVVNRFQTENSQTRRHEVDVLRAIEVSIQPSFQDVAPSGIVTFELFTESESVVQFASKEWNGGTLQPELMIYLSVSSPSTTPTRMPSTDEPTASPVTSMPSIEISLSPSFSESIEPSVTTQHPTVPISQVPSVMISETPTGSPFTPTASPIYPTTSPQNPTASPVYPTASPFKPSIDPTIHPTMSPETSAPVAVPVVLMAFDVCPNEPSSDTKHLKNDLVSYRVGSTWQVYKCIEDRCTGAPRPGQTESSWVLVGTCRDGPPELEDVSTPSPSPHEMIKATTIFPTPAPEEEVRHYYL